MILRDKVKAAVDAWLTLSTDEKILFSFAIEYAGQITAEKRGKGRPVGSRNRKPKETAVNGADVPLATAGRKWAPPEHKSTQ